MTTRLAQPLFGFDYTARCSPTILHAEGVRFVIRYLSRSGWKVPSAGEVHELEVNGIAVGFVFEDGAMNAWAGRGQGEADARWAIDQARAVCGADLGGKIFFAVDHDTAGDPGVTDPYFDGVAQVLGHERSGPYGSYEVIEHHANRGFQALYQTVAWSRGLVSGRALVYQSSIDHPIGPGVDFDHAYYADFGQWTHRAQQPPPDPYALFPRGPVRYHGGHIDERLTMEQIDGALQHRDRYRDYLKKALLTRARFLRDRIKTVAYATEPHDWKRHNRGKRWQAINARVRRITALR